VAPLMKKRSGDRGMSRDANYVIKDMASVTAGSAADYKAAFAQGSASAFAAAFAEDVVLEAAGMYWAVSGRENVKRVMDAASKMYESPQFTDKRSMDAANTLSGRRAFGGIGMSGVTVITRNEAGAIATWRSITGHWADP
jgi:hypothetical protein